MLDAADRRRVAEDFGADDAQVERDHLISHVIAALARIDPGQSVVFFGGTALARTHVPRGRLSEDLDLFCEDRGMVAARLTAEIPRELRREFAGLRWEPPLDETRDTEPALLIAAASVSLQVQLIDADATYKRWPTEVRPVEMRYSDVVAVERRVPTLAAFGAMKASAWRERHAARDLYDLWGLANLGAITPDAVQLLREVTGTPIALIEFDGLPKDLGWHARLAHQTRDLPSAEECLERVRSDWTAAAAGRPFRPARRRGR